MTGARELHLRTLDPADIPAVLRLVRPELEELVLGEEDLRRNLFEDPDACADLNLGAFEGGNLAGVACGVVRAETGFIKLLVVEPARRREGLGGRLLTELELRLAQRGAARAQTDGAAPVYLLPGLPVRCAEGRRFLDGRGYREVEARASMTAGLKGLDLEAREKEVSLAAGGILVRRASERDANLIVGQIESLFSPEWAVEVGFSLRRAVPGTHIALAGDRLAGFASAGVWARNAFGPMGTNPAHEGKGIGEVLLKRCLADLRDAGQDSALISWIGPEDFYRRKVGAETTHRYVVLGKALSTPDVTNRVVLRGTP